MLGSGNLRQKFWTLARSTGFSPRSKSNDFFSSTPRNPTWLITLLTTITFLISPSRSNGTGNFFAHQPKPFWKHSLCSPIFSNNSFVQQNLHTIKAYTVPCTICVIMMLYIIELPLVEGTGCVLLRRLWNSVIILHFNIHIMSCRNSKFVAQHNQNVPHEGI